MAEHELKVVQPYFDALLDGSKTFEVRRNDRGYQRGDTLVLRAYHADRHCYDSTQNPIRRTVTYVYADDPRFPALTHGVVVLGLSAASPR